MDQKIKSKYGVNGTRLFWYATSASIAVTVALLAFVCIDVQRLDHTPFSSKHDLIQTVVAALALILGTSSAVAGALATITLANLGINISDRQDARDQHRFVIDQYSSCVEIYSRLMFDMSRLFGATTIVGQAIGAYIDNHYESAKLLGGTPGTPSIEGLSKNQWMQEQSLVLEKCIDDFILSIRALASSSTASIVLHEKSLKLEFLRRKVEEQLLKNGTLNYIAHDGVQLADVVNFLELRANQIRRHNFKAIYEAYHIIKRSNVLADEVRKASDLTHFLFFGACCGYLSVEKAKELDGMLVSNSGAAMYRDMVRSIPVGKEILSIIEDQYPFLTCIDELKIPQFDPKHHADATLLSGLEALELHKSSLCFVFQGPEKKRVELI